MSALLDQTTGCKWKFRSSGSIFKRQLRGIQSIRTLEGPGLKASYSRCRKLTECRFFWYLRLPPLACPSTGRPHLIGGGVEAAAALTGVAVGHVPPGSNAHFASGSCGRCDREPMRKSFVVGVYSRIRRFMFFANLALVALCVFVFGWGWATHQAFRVEWNGRLQSRSLCGTAGSPPILHHPVSVRGQSTTTRNGHSIALRYSGP